MNEIICEKCNAVFTKDMIEIQVRAITKDESGYNINEQFFECPICGAHYIVTITDRQQRLMIQKRKQLKNAVKNAIRSRHPARAQTYKEKEREIAEELQARAKMLKETYRPYTEG